jgi:hypothetical protein
MDKPRRIFTLIRVSGDQQIDRTGIPRQIDTLAMIRKRDNVAPANAGDEYRFEGLSGALVDQFPKFMEMLRRLYTESDVVGIAFADISRFFRPEFLDQLGITRAFRETGKLIFYEDGVLDLRNDRDMKTFLDGAMEAGAYRKRLLKNTLWGRNERRNRGDCKSDPLPLGVKFFPHPRIKSELIVGHFEYTVEAKRVPEAYRRVLAGDSYSQIARDLGFYSPSELRDYLRSGWWIQEKRSYKVRIKAGLRDNGKRYSGKREKRDQPIIVPAKFNCDECKVYSEPLISRADFDAVQAILDRTERTWIRKTKERDHSPYIGIGVLFCSWCGRKLYSKPNAKAGKFYYRCSSFNNGNKPCGAPHIHQADMDRELQVFASIKMRDRKYINTLVPEVPQGNMAFIEKQLADTEKRLDGLYKRLDDPRFDQIRIENQIEETGQRKKDLNEQLAAASKPVKAQIGADELASRFKQFNKLPIAEQRDAIRKTFSKIVVDYVEGDGEVKPVIMAQRIELRVQPHR